MCSRSREASPLNTQHSSSAGQRPKSRASLAALPEAQTLFEFPILPRRPHGERSAGAQRGTSVEVRVGGLFLHDGPAFEITGPGIAAELHNQIFELNFSRTGAQPGKLGFGLWWVKTLMTRLGGSVTVRKFDLTTP